MADWVHKERHWSFIKQDDASGQEVSTADWKVTDHEWGTGIHEKNPKWLKFTDWLDMQCKGGWEVFKISRDFRNIPENNGTWCIFRRKK